MKKIIGTILLLALLSGCATAKVAGKIGDDIKEDRATAESLSESDYKDMAEEWFDVFLGFIEGAVGL